MVLFPPPAWMTASPVPAWMVLFPPPPNTVRLPPPTPPPGSRLVSRLFPVPLSVRMSFPPPPNRETGALSVEVLVRSSSKGVPYTVEPPPALTTAAYGRARASTTALVPVVTTGRLSAWPAAGRVVGRVLFPPARVIWSPFPGAVIDPIPVLAGPTVIWS